MAPSSGVHAHESARRNWGNQPFAGSSSSEQVRSPRSPPGPSLASLAAPEPGSRDRSVDRSPVRSGGSHCPFGQDEMYPRSPNRDNGLINEFRARTVGLIPELVLSVDGMWIL